MSESTPNNETQRFAELASQRRGGGPARELLSFLMANKKWWLLPIVVAVLGLGALVFLSSTGAAPFIYTLF